MRRMRLVFVALCLSALLISCGGQSSSDNPGYVTMMPYVSQAMGFRGVAPQGWTETENGQFSPPGPQGSSVQLVMVGTSDLLLPELEQLAVSQLGIEALPERSGIYKSRVLSWDLYEFQTDTVNVVQDVHVLLALSEGQQASYAVAMLAVETAFEADPSLYETIFIHVVHGLLPML